MLASPHNLYCGLLTLVHTTNLSPLGFHLRPVASWQWTPKRNTVFSSSEGTAWTSTFPSWPTTRYNGLRKKNRSKKQSRQNPKVCHRLASSSSLTVPVKHGLFPFSSFFFFEENLPFPVPLGEISPKPIVGGAIARGTTWHWSWPWFNIWSQIHEQLLHPEGNCCCLVIDTDDEIMLLFLLHYVWQRHELRNITKDIFVYL